jgi:hypothetical protein
MGIAACPGGRSRALRLRSSARRADVGLFLRPSLIFLKALQQSRVERTAWGNTVRTAASRRLRRAHEELPSGQNASLAGRNRGNRRTGRCLLGEIVPGNSHCAPTGPPRIASQDNEGGPSQRERSALAALVPRDGARPPIPAARQRRPPGDGFSCPACLLS